MNSLFRSFSRAALAMGCALACASHALAASGSPTPVNAVVFGTFSSTNSDSEGALIASHFDLSGYSVNSNQTQSTGLYSAGTVKLTNGQINGDAVVLGDLTLNGAGLTGQRLPNDGWATLGGWIDQQRHEMSVLSASFAATAANGQTVLTDYRGLVLTGDGTAATQVFQVDASALGQATSLAINGVSRGQGLVINVVGLQVSIANLDLSTTLGAYDSVLNFANAFEVTIASASPHAVVLAPGATIKGGSGHIEGLVVARNWQAGLELHNSRTSSLVNVTAPSPVPEPSSGLALALGLAGVGLVVRRRKQS